MIAAMVAAVSATSTLRVLSGPVGLSGRLALVDGVGLLEGLGVGIAAGDRATGPLKATGFAKPDAEGVVTATGTLLAGTFWRPTE
jgi:hypothetical protein